MESRRRKLPVLLGRPITDDDIRGWWRDEALAILGTGPGAEVARIWMIAIRIIGNILGAKWLNGNVLSTRRAERFLAFPKGDDDAIQFGPRVIDLAQTLYNLQSTPGFNTRLREYAKGGVEQMLTELEGAHQALSIGWEVEFVNPSGAKGGDYDLEVMPTATRRIAVEAKCKVAGADSDPSTLTNTLIKARKQLPENKPTIVFVRVPTEWVGDDAKRALVAEVVENAFRNSKRLSAVVFHAEVFFGDSSGRHGRGVASWHAINLGAKHPAPEASQLGGATYRARWQLLTDLVETDATKILQSLKGESHSNIDEAMPHFTSLVLGPACVSLDGHLGWTEERVRTVVSDCDSVRHIRSRSASERSVLIAVRRDRKAESWDSLHIVIATLERDGLVISNALVLPRKAAQLWVATDEGPSRQGES